MYPVTLTGRAVVLREFRADDAAGAFRIFGDDAVTASLSFDSRTPEEVTAIINAAIERARLRPRTEYYLAVTLPGDELIGFARLGFNGVQAAKLGYAIRADQWGHGYATDAARTLVAFGFEHLRLHRISAAVGPDNQASLAVVSRLGMRYEGRLRGHVFTNGAWRDSDLYAVLAGDTDGAGEV
ncbi:GNAT family N-acetyltransferase [Dactylosporangium sp. NPDC005555]|uniref:GNAT family N-acetyltransferase n=1 Tax=Dactylosporangium sp. NPDC005555 TaxID=3154889 RepID=UPI0033A6E628